MHQPMDGLQHIRDIAAKIGIGEDYLHYYGKLSAKVDLELLSDLQQKPVGKMILVTAMTPTSYGEGKTVTSIGLAQALERIGKRAIVTLREPSIGPVFGIKGGATGGGKSRVHPHEQINLHFNGDLHAITAAHNLLAAMVDTHIFHGNELRLDLERIQWPRAMDMNDRALRRVEVGGKGQERESGFVITAASEIMAILALARSRDDLRARLGEIVIGFDVDGKIVHARDLKIVGALMVLLNEAIMPNLVQTTEGTAGFVHCGPFANIAHGTCSVISQQMALRLAEYVVNESGFASDLGAEKYFDIVMPSTGIKPAAAVLIATVKALRAHGVKEGVSIDSSEALVGGFSNLRRHIDNLRKFGAPIVVSINRFEKDSEEDLRMVQSFCEASGVECSISDLFGKGGLGGIDLASKVVAAASKGDPGKVRSIYAPNLSLQEKADVLAREVYGANGVRFEPAAEQKLRAYAEQGYGGLPICVAKTQSSLSDNPKLLGAPSGWTLTISDARLSAGAGFVVLVAGNMMLMPGLPKHPQALEMDINEHAEIIGLR
jgi:formate--tetrahydrofolate ligase